MSLRSMHFGLGAIFALVVLALAIGVQIAGASNVVTGTVDKIDTTSKTIAVKTADGSVQVVKYTGDATVSGVKGVAKGAELTGKETGHVIVRTVGTGAEETAGLWPSLISIKGGAAAERAPCLRSPECVGELIAAPVLVGESRSGSYVLLGGCPPLLTPTGCRKREKAPFTLPECHAT
jgi:hypothetical protein